MSKVYMLCYPRPTGTTPFIYYNKPKTNPKEIEIEPGYFLIDPETDPCVQEFESELKARQYYKKYYPDLYNKLKVVNE